MIQQIRLGTESKTTDRTVPFIAFIMGSTFVVAFKTDRTMVRWRIFPGTTHKQSLHNLLLYIFFPSSTVTHKIK